jgi:acetoin utilization deacetylase AcuC-like enzyme
MGYSKTGVVKDRCYLNHNPGIYHIESPKRLEAIYQYLEMSKVSKLYQEIPPHLAKEEEICLIHTRDYLRSLADTSGRSVMLDPDTITSEKSYETACLAVGGVLSLMEAVFSNKIDNGFALIRPPGHHAEKNRAMGFCIFNNIAIGAAYVLKKGWVSRILIVDWDVHHGNGTQNAFYRSSEVLYFSTHQYPHYPMTGRLEETGKGEGKGYTVNVPLSAGCGDRDYLYIFNHLLKPIAYNFKPELILVSAGFDPYIDDPLSDMNLTIKGFAYLAQVLRDIAEKTSNHRLIFILEGGYALEGLAHSIEAVIKVLLGENFTPPKDFYKNYNPSNSIKRAVDFHKQFWHI